MCLFLITGWTNKALALLLKLYTQKCLKKNEKEHLGFIMYSIAKLDGWFQSDYIKIFWISHLCWLSFKLYESFVRPNIGYEGTIGSDYIKVFFVCWISQFFGICMMDSIYQVSLT